MQRITSFLLGLFLLLGGMAVAMAQDKPQEKGMNQPPKVLAITREFVKPGKAGMVHQKAEAAFVQAFTTAKWPTHYLAVTSLSGKARVLFMSGFDSFEAMEKDSKAVEQNASLTTALDRASVNDGELLSDYDQGVFLYREDLSHAGSDLPHMRYFEITVFRVKPGHEKDFDALAKIYSDAYMKAAPDVHWAAYEGAYGTPGGTILIFTPMKSASEIDHNYAQWKQIEEAMGEEGLKKARELAEASVESTQTNLFSFEPKMSYVPPEWVKADPSFWTVPTMMAASHKKAAETAKKQ